MKYIKMTMLVVTVFFLVEYEGYEWNPCDDGNCLAIYCGPSGMCSTPATQYIVKTLGEVREIVDKNGTEHLSGMYRIEWNSDQKQATVTLLKLVPSYAIEDDNQEIDKDTP